MKDRQEDSELQLQRQLQQQLTNLSSLGVGGQQVNNLDTSNQNLLLHAHLAELYNYKVEMCTMIYSKNAVPSFKTEGRKVTSDVQHM